ncbi:hypothetical protein LX12_003855 [Williamsia serinedens]|uniref:Uncharacterized protein n=1 Tax=Williamsia serinedens TaxID=391736 RepID=A0ABT1H5Y3_9NOCA|nr:hypothetical protein [Williamsia serinedens]
MKVPRVTLVQLVTAVVIAMWVIANIADIFLADYTPPESLNTAFMALVGPLLALMVTRRGDKTDDDKTSGSDEHDH